jgi:hypothetical protein
MVIISINGKKLDREFQNMSQALAFAYQRGECHGAKVVELAQEGAGKKGGPGAVGGFTQADIDAACEKYAKEANEQIVSQLEALNIDNKAKEAEIAELKAQLTAVDVNTEQAQKPKEILLEDMHKEQLLYFAVRTGIDVNYTASRDEILATIQAAIANNK